MIREEVLQQEKAAQQAGECRCADNGKHRQGRAVWG